jgi:hypothetical protein
MDRVSEILLQADIVNCRHRIMSVLRENLERSLPEAAQALPDCDTRMIVDLNNDTRQNEVFAESQ